MIEQVMATDEHDAASGKYGNCMSACFAALLNIPIERIPNFDDPMIFDDAQRPAAQLAFLRKQGFALVGLGFQSNTFEHALNFSSSVSGGAPCIISGASMRGVNHAVVVQSGKIIMNPSTAPIAQPTSNGAYYIEWAIQIQPHWSQDVAIRFYN